jgi:predicted nucleic acid-binding protein
VKVVIADTGPINYLLLIGQVELLPKLFEKVVLPSAVKDELSDPETPAAVRNWIAVPPQWLEIRHARDLRAVIGLGAGEAEAIALALELHADLLLMDDRRGVKAARGNGIEVTGTLGVLGLAGKRRLIDLAEVFDRLKKTNFRYPRTLMDEFLQEDGERPTDK